jgi:hypothetical protein
MKKAKKGIYCLEIGEWFGSMKKKHSVEPVLELLHDSPLAVPYIHRDIATKTELRYYLRKWAQNKHVNFPILYLAFHGSPGCIHLAKENGHSDIFSTDDLFDLLTNKCHKRVIHFGACSVLNMHGHKINKYLKDSGAVAISGYRQDVGWINSSIFEMLYLAELQGNQFTKPGLRAAKNRVRKIASPLSKMLNFRMRIRR